MTPQVAAGRLDRLVEVLDDVKPIEQDLRIGGVGAHQPGVRRSHVQPVAERSQPPKVADFPFGAAAVIGIREQWPVLMRAPHEWYASTRSLLAESFDTR